MAKKTKKRSKKPVKKALPTVFVPLPIIDQPLAVLVPVPIHKTQTTTWQKFLKWLTQYP